VNKVRQYPTKAMMKCLGENKAWLKDINLKARGLSKVFKRCNHIYQVIQSGRTQKYCIINVKEMRRFDVAKKKSIFFDQFYIG